MADVQMLHVHIIIMAEEKISAALNDELEVVEKECMRPMQVSGCTTIPVLALRHSSPPCSQRQAFLCSAKCCEDRHCSQEVMQRCIQTCMRPMMEAEQNLKSEIEQFQVV